MITLKAKSYRYANDVGINMFILSRERADNPLPKRIYSHGKDVLRCKEIIKFRLETISYSPKPLFWVRVLARMPIW